MSVITEDITDINQLDVDGTYTYADYLQWKFEEYVELFRGKLRRMSPAPMRWHQDVAGNIHSELRQYLKKKPCKAYIAPFDVRLPAQQTELNDRQIYTVVQPDVCIICDAAKLDKRGCIGAPDTIIEVVSKGNTDRDLKQKFSLYEEHGVPEYWIVWPVEKIILIYLLKEEKYVSAGEYSEPGQVPVHSLPGFSIEWSEIFED